MGVGILIALGVLYFLAGELIQATADEQDASGPALWIHDGDAAPGSRIAVRIRDYQDKRHGVHVHLDGRSQYFEGDGSDTVDFDLVIPSTAEPGSNLDLTIDDVFHRTVHVRTPTMALVRRVGRVATAFASAFVLALLLVRAVRFHFRRRWRPSPAYYLLAISLLPLGYVAFSRPLAAVVGTHATGFHIGALVAWFGLLLVPARARLRTGLPRYVASPVLLANAGVDAPFRSAQVSEKLVTLEDLQLAWSALGLVAQRRRKELVIMQSGVGNAIVPIAGSEIFDAASVEVYALDPSVAKTVLQGTANTLGSLRVTQPDGSQLLVEPTSSRP